MERNEVEARIKKVIAKVLSVDEQEIAADANFVFDLGADSMQSLEFVGAFEEEFGIEMDEDDALTVQSVSGAVEFIKAIIDHRIIDERD